MSPLVTLIVGFIAMIGVFVTIFGAMLAFRDPKQLVRLSDARVEFAAIVVLVALATVVIGLQVKALMALGEDPAVALVVVTATAMLCGSTIWRKLNIRERIDAARHGFSPFTELRHIRHHRRHRFDGSDFGSGAAGTA